MKPGDERYRILYELQHKCNELNRKIDSLIRMMEMLTTYMKYSSIMTEMAAVQPSNLILIVILMTGRFILMTHRKGVIIWNPGSFRKL